MIVRGESRNRVRGRSGDGVRGGARGKCIVRGCPNRAGFYGLCQLHRQRAWRLMRTQPEFRKLAYRDKRIVRHIAEPEK